MAPYLPHRPHPWHGLPLAGGAPGLFHAYIEITPFDKVKYEVDKATGYLKVDRPQRTASLPPTLYGFLPRTLCAGHVAALCEGEDERHPGVEVGIDEPPGPAAAVGGGGPAPGRHLESPPPDQNTVYRGIYLDIPGCTILGVLVRCYGTGWT